MTSSGGATFGGCGATGGVGGTGGGVGGGSSVGGSSSAAAAARARRRAGACACRRRRRSRGRSPTGSNGSSRCRGPRRCRCPAARSRRACQSPSPVLEVFGVDDGAVPHDPHVIDGDADAAPARVLDVGDRDVDLHARPGRQVDVPFLVALRIAVGRVQVGPADRSPCSRTFTDTKSQVLLGCRRQPPRGAARSVVVGRASRGRLVRLEDASRSRGRRPRRLPAECVPERAAEVARRGDRVREPAPRCRTAKPAGVARRGGEEALRGRTGRRARTLSPPARSGWAAAAGPLQPGAEPVLDEVVGGGHAASRR